MSGRGKGYCAIHRMFCAVLLLAKLFAASLMLRYERSLQRTVYLRLLDSHNLAQHLPLRTNVSLCNMKLDDTVRFRRKADLSLHGLHRQEGIA